jgi:type 1 glutamine amidotransferase
MTEHPSDDIRLAVVTGNHPFDVPAFYRLFRQMDGITFYLQDLDNLVADWGDAFDSYDALLFYNMHRGMPEGRRLEMLQRLGEREHGIVVLHHGVLAFDEWQPWYEICGVQGQRFSYHPDQQVRLEIADAEHAIIQGLDDWTMEDETYTLGDADEESHILITTEHPQSMRTIAWTRTYRQARVFCFVSGHDNKAYSHPSFATVLDRGIRWSAGHL